MYASAKTKHFPKSPADLFKEGQADQDILAVAKMMKAAQDVEQRRKARGQKSRDITIRKEV